jgi:hypothetical protein
MNMVNFLTKLIGWVQTGTAPGTVSANTWSRTENKIVQHQTVQPYNALAPVTPVHGSLNGHYDYIGRY